MYKGRNSSIRVCRKADKKTIDTLKKNLKEEESFGDWLERNNPKGSKKVDDKTGGKKQKARKKKVSHKKMRKAILYTSVA